jgi:hypothetical protein
MLLLNSFYLVGLSTALAAVAAPGPENACGKLNVIFTFVSKQMRNSNKRLTYVN